MNQRLPDRHIRLTCRELLAHQPRVTGRHLRRVLKEQYGSVGNTARIFKIWREEAAALAEHQRMSALPTDTQELIERLQAAEATAEAQRLRAERAELREQAHQDHWALEIDRLRQQLRAQPNYASEVRGLQDQVMRLTVELHATRRLLTEPAANAPAATTANARPAQPGEPGC